MQIFNKLALLKNIYADYYEVSKLIRGHTKEYTS